MRQNPKASVAAFLLSAFLLRDGHAQTITRIVGSDGTTIADVVPANTAPAASKKALVVTISPNSPSPAGSQDVNLIKVGGAAISIGQALMAASLPVAIASNQTALAITATSLPLPAGAATEATLATLNGKLGTLGQKTSAGSAPVVIASDQSAIPVTGSLTPSGTQNVNLTQVAGSGVALGQTTMASSLPVAIASNQTALAITAASLPLPAGAATEATLTTLNGKLGTLGQKTSAGSAPVVIASDQSAIPVTGSLTPSGTQNVNLTQVAGSGVALGQTTMASSLPVAIASNQTTLAVSAASLPLPAGAATEATLATRAADATITARLGTLGQKTSSGSTPVVIASDQSAVPVSGTVTVVSTTANQGTPNTIGNSWPVEITDGSNVLGTSAHPIRTDPTGATTQPVSGTVTANVGTTGGLALDTTVAGLQVAQASTTSGQKGNLDLGAVTTSAPTYTNAQSSPLSLTTSGALRVDSSSSTQPVSVTPGTSATTTAVALTTTGAAVFSSTANVKARKIYNRSSNPIVYCVYFSSTNVTSEATASFSIAAGQTWEMPSYTGVAEYTGQINCATSTSTGSIQALQVL